ncbi:ABC transporter substrate-binding protein [Silvibacterium dinghuense]|uniref:ABC transporter substrate-binding protein n=1 Tax=Silvibacterium dinghuense TaxID=1560006 RepID=A0A4Q1SGL8_9BACT|nr:ABC transporter substrate-binding protein [Silvibacterium dinghuense]RXS96495.1 ABC transporter substrate-binding protein [Silvibacterium dinghuense]GGG91250.1 cobalamin-binding protein [Silvibacterium dinghuense]
MRILSLQPSVSILLHHLGRLDTLVACTRYCLDAVPELRERHLAGKLAIVQDSWSITPDELLPVAADLIVASIPYRMESLAAILRAGRPVLALAPHTLEDIYQEIRLLAGVVGETAKGEALVTAMDTTIAGMRARTRDFQRPRVYCEEWGKPMIHSQIWVKELVEAAGGSFLGEPGTHTQAEDIAKADPDVIVMAWCGAGNRVPLERVVEQRAWEELRAVREGRVYCIADEMLNTPAPTLAAGLAALAQCLHPDVFGTLAPPSGRPLSQFPPHCV